MKIGDRVEFKESFLQSIGAPAEIANMQGVITKIDPKKVNKNFYVKVLWNNEKEERGCLSCNIRSTKIYCPCGFPQSFPVKHEHERK